MKKLKIFSKSGLIALLALALITGAVLGAYMLTKEVQVSVNVVPSGSLLVTPTELIFGEMVRGEYVNRDISFENTSDDPLTITWATEISFDGITVLNVDDNIMGWVLVAGQTVTQPMEFAVPLDAEYGKYQNLTWQVYGTTP